MKSLHLASVVLVGLIFVAIVFFFESSLDFTTPTTHQLFQK